METIDKLINQLTQEIDVRPKRIIRPGYEKESRLETVRKDSLTRSQIKKRAKQRREATAGAKWFDMPTKDLEVEDKLTLDALRLRETLDPGKFYKRKATDNVSKQFQIGTVIEHPMEYYSARAIRKERKPTLVDELISDIEFKQKVKKRYHRQKATQAIKQKEKALADRRKMLQGKKKQKPRMA